MTLESAQNEEQEMEAEALEAIFDHHFQPMNPQEWTIEIYPEMTAAGDDEVCVVDDESTTTNHVACKLIALLPRDYPESNLPQFTVDIVKGLAIEHVSLLQELAAEEAEANEGLPCIFAVCEKIREWLMDNNVKGLDDRSMYSQMIRKQQQEQKTKAEKVSAFESQTQQEEMTQAEIEELTVRKRREEGTPCNKENFDAWRAKFDEEMAQERAKSLELSKQDDGGGGSSSKKNKEKKVDKSGRLTGYQQFCNTASMNLEALEAAAEQAELEEMEEEDAAADVDEDLFLDDDDDDLDDLDFDDDDEDIDI